MKIIVTWETIEKTLEVNETVILPNGVLAKLQKTGIVQLSAGYKCTVYDRNGEVDVDHLWPSEFRLRLGYVVFEIHGINVTFKSA